jgi:uncharacterized BrkB/YihY/UPF0761 family membrane protein
MILKPRGASAPAHWLLSICVWVLRLTPLILLVALVVSSFLVESDDEDVQKADHEFQNMVTVTTAAMVSHAILSMEDTINRAWLPARWDNS